MFFKKKKEANQMTTLEEVRKAYEDLSEEDKKSFHQSLSDRVHESIAAQEDHGQTDSQSAADREHEALGAEHADERAEEAKRDVSGDEKDAKQDERAEEAHEQAGDRMATIERRLDELAERIEAMGKRDVMEEKREKYGLSQHGTSPESKKEYTDKDIDALLGR